MYCENHIYIRASSVIITWLFIIISTMPSLYCCSSFSLRAMNYTAAVFHLVQAAIVLGIIQHLNHKADTSSEYHGLRNGVFQIKKSIFVIKDSPPATLHADEIWSNGETLKAGSLDHNANGKCDLPAVQIYNGSGPLNAFSTFTSPTGNGMTVRVNRNDIYMFDKMFVVPQNVNVGDLDIRYVIFFFFLLSGLFQLADGFSGAYSASNNSPRLLRFVEYSFSASIMILAIAVETGLTDIYTLVCVFTLIFTTNLLGLIAEVFCFCAEILYDSSSAIITKIDSSFLPTPFAWLWTIPHLLGWVTCIIGYAPLLDSYLQSTRCSERGPPGFVNVIVFLEFALFSCFGFVQFYSLYYRTEACLSVGQRRVWTPSTNATGNSGGATGVAYRPVFAAENGLMVEEGSGINGPVSYLTPSISPGKAIQEQADYIYIMLSFIAKTLLAWLILSPVMANS
jgi:hypothetical protein